MAVEAAPGAPAGLGHEAKAPSSVHLDVQADEDDVLAGMGALGIRCPHLTSVELAVSPRVGGDVTEQSISMLFMFSSLRRLQLRFDFDDITVTQRMVNALAELLQLDTLHVLHGSLAASADLGHLSSLKRLQELKLLPAHAGGLRDEQMRQLTLLSTSLTSLAVRPHAEAATVAGLWALASLTHLVELSVAPLPEGEAVAKDELQQLLDMPRLQSLQLGVSDAAQVLLLNDVRLSQQRPRLSLLIRDACEPGPAADVLTVISWRLPQQLVRLSLGPLATAAPGSVLVTLATLQGLQCLELQLLAPPDQHVSGSLDILSLTPCHQLTCLELLTSSRLHTPLTVKTVSLAALAWPKLAALRLSLAGKPEAMPEALDMADNFVALTELQLCAPLDDSPLEEPQQQAPQQLTRASSWSEWALGLVGGNGGGSQTPGSRLGGGAGGAAVAGGNGSPLARTASGGRASVSSPLARDVRQRTLVAAQHWQAHAVSHAEHAQYAHQLQADAAHGAAAVSSLYTLPEQQQQLPAAVASFQQHKLVSADAVFGSGAWAKRAASLDSQGSGGWSPRWLLSSFAPPAAGTADGSGPGLQDAGSWGLLGACRAVLPRAASLERGPSGRLSTASMPGSPQSVPQAAPPLQQPGAELAMYRAGHKLLALNLTYLPRALNKLCLQSCHLVAVGLPDTRPAARASSQQLQQPAPQAGQAGDGAPGSLEPQQEQECQALQACTPGGGSSSSMEPVGVASLQPLSLSLPHLVHLELEGCRVDDVTMVAVLRSSPQLRALEIAGIEGLTNGGLHALSSCSSLTRLCIEAEHTPGISLACMAFIRRVHTLRKLHFCSADSLDGPVDADRLTAQLCCLKQLRQLILLLGPETQAGLSGWRTVLQRRLPLCRLVMRRELLALEAWGDVPAEGEWEQ